jgi:DNA-binding MarR family transcriptional regulator
LREEAVSPDRGKWMPKKPQAALDDTRRSAPVIRERAADRKRPGAQPGSDVIAAPEDADRPSGRALRRPKAKQVANPRPEPDVIAVLEVAADSQRAVHRQLKKFSRRTNVSDRAVYILHLIEIGLNRPSLLIDYFDVLPSTITTETDKLVEAELIVREPDPADRRVIRLVLTDRGRALAGEAMALINQMFLPRVRNVPEAELRACLNTLRKIVYPVDPAPEGAEGAPAAKPRGKAVG